VAQAVGCRVDPGGSRLNVRDAPPVHADVVGEFSDRLSASHESLVVGDPTNRVTNVGPLISAANRERVEGFIQRAVTDGSRLVSGGSRPEALHRGFFIQPTVFADVDNA
jgi:aldehyde dehydrogenase (NAD+)